MPTPGLSREIAEEAIARVETALRQGGVPAGMGGGQSALEMAGQQAVKDGWIGASNTLHARVRSAKERHGLEPDWSLYHPKTYHQPKPALVLTPAAPPEREHIEPQSEGERVLVIPDLHQDPRHPDRLDVLTWLARYASEERFGRIIQLGDWSTNDSVSRHDKNDTFAGRFKPAVKDDLANLQASHAAWHKGKAEGYLPRQTALMGNHDFRLELYEDAHPEAQGAFTLARDTTFAQYGWRTRPYGELFYCQGVAFTHHPINGAGRAFGGETGPARAANKSTVPIVSGHTHRRALYDSGKIGPVPSIAMVEAGCALPWGVVENYAKLSPGGWWWGAVAMTVRSGIITDLEFRSMLRIRDRYSDDGADRRAA